MAPTPTQSGDGWAVSTRQGRVILAMTAPLAFDLSDVIENWPNDPWFDVSLALTNQAAVTRLKGMDIDLPGQQYIEGVKPNGIE